MTKKLGGATLSNHIEQLKKDGKYDDVQHRHQRNYERIRELELEDETDEAALVSELNEAGADISSVWDLVNRPRSYPTIVPILLKHLKIQRNDRVREGIARALAVRDSIIVWHELVDCFESEKDETTSGIKWALHLALSAAADKSVIDDLIRLASDRRHGENRIFFLRAILRVGGNEAIETIRGFEDDPTLRGAVREILSE